MDAALLVAAASLFLLEQAVQIWARKLHYRPSDDVVVLDAWRQLVSDVDIVDSIEF